MKKLLTALGLVLLLIAATLTTALAWPDQPPDKAVISGPGIEGEVQIKDAAVLKALKLGTIEDFDSGRISAPNVSGGYKIVRYFYGGSFDFARLTYYPMPQGQRSYLYWDDGPMLEGDHTPYHKQWLYAQPEADKILKALLNQLEAAQAPQSSSNVNAAQAPQSSSNVNAPPPTNRATAADAQPTTSLALPLMAGVLGLIIGGGLVYWRLRR